MPLDFYRTVRHRVCRLSPRPSRPPFYFGFVPTRIQRCFPTTIPFNLNFPSRPRPRHCLTRLERHRLASSSASRSSRVFSPSHTSASSSVLVAASAAATLAATGPVLFQQEGRQRSLVSCFPAAFVAGLFLPRPPAPRLPPPRSRPLKMAPRPPSPPRPRPV